MEPLNSSTRSMLCISDPEVAAPEAQMSVQDRRLQYEHKARVDNQREPFWKGLRYHFTMEGINIRDYRIPYILKVSIREIKPV